jgi:hypothetical protein
MKTSIVLLFFISALFLSLPGIAQKVHKTSPSQKTFLDNQDSMGKDMSSVLSDSSDILNVSKAGLRISDALDFDEATLGSAHLLFGSPTASDTTIIHKEGIGISANSFIGKLNANFNAGAIEFENQLYRSIFGSGGVLLAEFDIDTFSTQLFPGLLRQQSKDCITNIMAGEIALYNSSSPWIESVLTKDTLRFYKESVGLLFNEESNLSSLALDFEFGPTTASYGTFGMINDNGTNNITIGPFGIIHKESFSPGNTFNRFTLEPDSLVMYNSAKQRTIRLGVDQQSLGGTLTLFDSQAKIHTSIIDDQNGDVTMQMNHQGDLRVWLGTFQEGGIINTVGQNGSMNTYLGRADRHLDGRFGGLGVMDDVSILRAGMEVDESRKGLVYTNGSIKVFDNADFNWTETNRYGYYLYNSSGGFTATLTSDVLDANVGYLSAYGTNQAPNFFAGANWNFNGNGNSGIASVLDDQGVDQAAILVNQNNEGIVFSDFAFFGSEPNNNPVYSLQVQQQPNYGLGLFRDNTNFYEFYINSNNDLAIFFQNATIGTFDNATGAYNQVSDRRMKKNIRSLNSTLDNVQKLVPSRYTYIHDNANSESIGFVAQEVETVFPELVTTTKDKEGKDLKAINYSGLSVIAIKAIQEQQEIIEQQNKRIRQLENQIAEIKALLEKR